MHATERERAILNLLKGNEGFISFRSIEKQIAASPATLRRDLERLAGLGVIERVRGGARLPEDAMPERNHNDRPSIAPFQENINRMQPEKAAIGKRAAALSENGASIMIDGGSTTVQMCPHLDGKNLQVFTNSLHIVELLLPQQGTRILIPGGSLFREQNIILSATGDDTMPRFHAPLYFRGASAVGPHGVMQPDVILVAAERRLMDKAERMILLVDHSKFKDSSGNVVCGLDKVDTIVTNDRVKDQDVAMLESAGVNVIIA